MFTIFPLHMASNVFHADSAEELEKFYGFDKNVANVDTSSLDEEKSFANSTQILSKVKQLPIQRNENAPEIPNLPKGVTKIVLFEKISEIKALHPGEMAIIGPNTKSMRAYYMPIEEINNTM